MMDNAQMTLALVAVLLILYVVVNYGTLTADAEAGYGSLTDGSIGSWAMENPLMAGAAALAVGVGGYYMYYGELPMMSKSSAPASAAPAPANGPQNYPGAPAYGPQNYPGAPANGVTFS